MQTPDTPKPDLRVPSPRRDWALFLDIDGTLIEIAAKPDAVIVPPNLAATLEAASRSLGGALAVVSGRPLSAIDHLLSPLNLPCAAEHGAVLRLPDGSMLQPGARRPLPQSWRERIRGATRGWKGVLVGEKSFSIALHYRLAPEREQELKDLVHDIVQEDPEFEVLPARMAFEIRHHALNKGEAVKQFMRSAPFAGRTPVFVGDDVTDEDGFRAVLEMNGIALHVDQVFEGKPALVRDWLERFHSLEG